MSKGFFPNSVWSRQKEPLSLVPLCGQCGLWQHCKSGKMPVTGQGKRRILIVAEAPGKNEDDRGIQLCGNAGGELIRLLHKVGIHMRRDCWLDNALRCFPKDTDGKNRTPTNDEIAFCRPNLSKSLFDLQPDIVIPLGETALRSLIPLIWKEGEVSDMGTWAGWQIPSQEINAWVCPTYHPSYLLHKDDDDRPPNPVAEKLVTQHLRAAEKLKGKPYPNGVPDDKSKVKLIYNAEEAAKEIRLYMAFNNPLAFDYETTTLKPDGPHSRILCCGISDGTTAFAFPWEGTAIEQMKIFLRSNVRKIGANIKFEDRWTRRILKIITKNWWWDVVLGAHWQDCRHGTSSVKFQSFVQLGARDYDSHVDEFKKSKGGNSNTPNRMHKLEISDLLTYCGLDALYEAKLAFIQRKGLPHAA